MSEEILGSDLRLEPGPFGFGLVAERGDQGGDLETVNDTDNLAQALLVRFNTPAGELTDLGHPGYGSRLHRLIGRPNNQSTRNLVRMFALETLRAEPRVAAVRHLDVGTVAGRPDLVQVAIEVLPISIQNPLNLVFSVHLEAGS